MDALQSINFRNKRNVRKSQQFGKTIGEIDDPEKH